MNFDFDDALHGLCGTITYFNFGCFTRKDTVPSKAQHFLVSVLFSISVQDMEAKFYITTRHKAVFWVYASNICSRFSSSYPY